jgi:hypothetical protein
MDEGFELDMGASEVQQMREGPSFRERDLNLFKESITSSERIPCRLRANRYGMLPCQYSTPSDKHDDRKGHTEGEFGPIGFMASMY